MKLKYADFTVTGSANQAKFRRLALDERILIDSNRRNSSHDGVEELHSCQHSPLASTIHLLAAFGSDNILVLVARGLLVDYDQDFYRNFTHFPENSDIPNEYFKSLPIQSIEIMVALLFTTVCVHFHFIFIQCIYICPILGINKELLFSLMFKDVKTLGHYPLIKNKAEENNIK